MSFENDSAKALKYNVQIVQYVQYFPPIIMLFVKGLLSSSHTNGLPAIFREAGALVFDHLDLSTKNGQQLCFILSGIQHHPCASILSMLKSFIDEFQCNLQNFAQADSIEGTATLSQALHKCAKPLTSIIYLEDQLQSTIQPMSREKTKQEFHNWEMPVPYY